MQLRYRPLRASILGAGTVGTALAVALHRRGFRIISVISAHLSSARRCARLVGCPRYSARVKDLADPTELLVLSVPDEAIRAVAREVSMHRGLDFRALKAFHTSGSLTSAALEPLRRKGALTLSLHPIQSFPKTAPLEQLMKSMRGISYGIEGGRKAIAFGRILVRQLDGRLLIVPKEEKILYHLACVLASNYPIALLAAVEELVARFVRPPRLRHFEPLIETSIRNALRWSPERALTGPISRGGGAVVEAHLRALRNRSLLRDVYRALGGYAAKLSQRAGRLTRRQQRAMMEILSHPE